MRLNTPTGSPVCSRKVPELSINQHLDNSCSNVSSSKDAPDVIPCTASTPGSSQKKTKTTSDSMAPIFNLKNRRAESSGQSPLPIHSESAKKRVAEDSALFHGPIKRRKTSNIQAAAPLAEKLRPGTLAEFVGQPHLTGADSLLMNSLAGGSSGSYIFWGPPGYSAI